MSEFVLQFFTEKTAWEWLAVILALAYLILAMRQNILCWPAAFISTAIYTGLFWSVALPMDSVLNVYYMGMAVWGFYLWNSPKAGRKQATSNNAPLKISTWSASLHFKVIGSIVVVSSVSGAFLHAYTEAAWPYLDSFTTWASVVTTYMVAKKIFENWLYWIVIDAVAMVMYIERGLYPTALLFGIYLVMCVFGFFAWKRAMDNEPKNRSWTTKVCASS